MTSLGQDLKLRSTEDFSGRKSVEIDSPIEHHLAIPGFDERPPCKRWAFFLVRADGRASEVTKGSRELLIRWGLSISTLVGLGRKCSYLKYSKEVEGVRFNLLRTKELMFVIAVTFDIV